MAHIRASKRVVLAVDKQVLTPEMEEDIKGLIKKLRTPIQDS
jgi:hypothetical protein